MSSHAEKAQKIRELIELWVKRTQSQSNVRGQTLLTPSHLIDGRVFDDYTAGLKLYLTYIRPENPCQRPGHPLFCLEGGRSTIQFQTRPIDSFLTERSTDIISFKIDVDAYEKLYYSPILEVTSSGIYKEFFGDDKKAIETTRKYLRNFYPFTDEDFTKGKHQYPFAELFVVETHISLLHYYAKYYEDRAAFEKYELPTSKSSRDYIGLKELKNRTDKTLKNCEELLKTLTKEHNYFGRELGSATNQLYLNLMYMYHELSVNKKNLSMYKQSNNICEALLITKIANDILSLDIYGDKYPGIPTPSQIRRELEEHFRFDTNSQDMAIIDYFPTAYPVCNNTLDPENFDFIETFDQYSYSLPKDPYRKKKYITGNMDIDNIKDLKSTIFGWLKHSPAKDIITYDMVKQRVKSLENNKKKPYSWRFEDFLKR